MTFWRDQTIFLISLILEPASNDINKKVLNLTMWRRLGI